MDKQTKFQELVKCIAEYSIEFPSLKAISLAQALMESGFCDTKLAMDHNNFWGMKFRSEMKCIAKSVYYVTATEPTGGADFCSFQNVLTGVAGYWKFLERSPYRGWRAEAAKSPEAFLSFISKIWCPVGFTEEWELKHAGRNYFEHIVAKLLPIAINALKAYEDSKASKPPAPTPEPTKPKIKIMLNPGHAGASGARGKNKDIKEEEFTELQAQEIKKHLDSYDKFKTDIIRQNEVGGLAKVGQAAKDYDLALSLHFNAYDSKEHGICFLGGRNKPKTIKFAYSLCSSLSSYFKIPVMGFLDKSVRVTKEFDLSPCPIAFLLETEFIDDEIVKEDFKKDVIKSAEIIALCIKKELLI